MVIGTTPLGAIGEARSLGKVTLGCPRSDNGFACGIMNLRMPWKWLLFVVSEAIVACLISGPKMKKPIIPDPTHTQAIERQIVIF
jgi:hypothetical protein